MNTIASTSAAATRAPARLQDEFTSVFLADRSGEVQKADRAHRHGRGGHDDVGPVARPANDGGQAWATLSLKVTQTFSALAGTGSTGTGTTPEAGDAGAGAAASLRVRVEIQAAGSGDAFEVAMKGFVQALYGALQTLFNPSGGPDKEGTATQPIKVAPPAPGIAAGEPDPGIDVPAPVAAAAPGTLASLTSTPAPVDSPAATPAPVDAPAAAAPRSLSVQVRLSYGGGLNGSLGSLVSQLAAQQSAAGTGSTAAAGGDAGKELVASFQRLLDASPGAAASGTTLSSFLQALARSFGQPASLPPEPASDPVADPAATSDTRGAGQASARYSMAAAYSVVQGDTRLSMSFRMESGPRAPAALATWA